MQKFVKVPLKKYLNLENNSITLSLLECAGVDNWEGYDYAFKDYCEEDELKEKDITFEIIEEE